MAMANNESFWTLQTEIKFWGCKYIMLHGSLHDMTYAQRSPSLNAPGICPFYGKGDISGGIKLKFSMGKLICWAHWIHTGP